MDWNGENRPIFVVGSYRSGTSVLTWCIGQHPNILPLPETHWIARLTGMLSLLYKTGTVHGRFSHLSALGWDEDDFFSTFGQVVDQFVVNTKESRLSYIRKITAKKLGLSDEQVAEMQANGKLSPDGDFVTAKNYQIVRSPSDPKKRWVDGTPENTFYMYSLSKLFPEAKFIHILREPDDVAKSLMSFSKAGGAGTDYSESLAYGTWQRLVDYAVKGELALGRERVFRILYEELVSDAEHTLRKCFDFIEEDFSSDCLLPLREKINSSNIGTRMKKGQKSKICLENQAANDFYQSILGLEPGEPDVGVTEELSSHFYEYVKNQYNE